MSETPAAAVKRMQKELANVQKLRANVALALLGPIHDSAVQRIKDTAASLVLPSTVLLKPPGLAPVGTPIEVPVVTPPPVAGPTILGYDAYGKALHKGDAIHDNIRNIMGHITTSVGTDVMYLAASGDVQYRSHPADLVNEQP